MRLQVEVLVADLLHRDAGPVLEKLPSRNVVGRCVDRLDGNELPIAEEELAKLARQAVAAFDDDSGHVGQPRDLQLHRALVRPEPGGNVIARGIPRDRFCNGLGHVGRILHRFEPQVPAKVARGEDRQVADGVDVRHVRAQVLIYKNAAIAFDSRRRNKVVVSDYAQTHDREVAWVGRARSAGHGGDVAVLSDKVVKPLVEVQLHSQVGVHLREVFRHRRRQDALHGALGKIDDSDVEPALRRDRRELQADEPGTDHHDTTVAPIELGTLGLGILDRAQVADALQLTARAMSAASLGTGSDDELAVSNWLATFNAHQTSLAVDARDFRPRPQIDIALV